MINGIMTLSGAWHRLREDPVLQFMIVALSFYGMSTFEGPLMSIRVVNALSHYTNWTIGHVHSGALGWVGFITFGAMYYLVPVLWHKQRLYSMRLVHVHLWTATVGIVLYITAMWVAGITQGLMWRSYDANGFLTYSFVESVQAIHIDYVIRALGGLLYFFGMCLMVYNAWKTVRDVPSIGATPSAGTAILPEVSPTSVSYTTALPRTAIPLPTGEAPC
jgi:cytochrome c oxidase cbb3-type subunit 1